MPNFLALYRGRTIAEAKLIAVSADPHIVKSFAAQLLKSETQNSDDPIQHTLDLGHERALDLIANEDDSSGCTTGATHDFCCAGAGSCTAYR